MLFLEAMNQEYVALEHELSRKMEEKRMISENHLCQIKMYVHKCNLQKYEHVHMKGCMWQQDDKSTEWR